MISFKEFEFAKVVKLPFDYYVFDLSTGHMVMPEGQQYAVGKYNELRPNIYSAEQYQNTSDPDSTRNIHMGVDIFAPINTAIHSFYDGVVYMREYNSLELDYGYTVIIEYDFQGTKLYALFGHLNKVSFDNNPPGKQIFKGDVFAWMGDYHENGGWPSHLHLQLSYERPDVCDMPGVVSKKDLAKMIQRHPDPRLVLGQLY